jgi:hypothetical protein
MRPIAKSEKKIKLVVLPRIAEKRRRVQKKVTNSCFVGDSGSWIFWRLPRPRAALS